MSTTRLLTACVANVDALANAPGTDRGTRASALSALRRRVDEQIQRLAFEAEAVAKRNGLNPISQCEGD